MLGWLRRRREADRARSGTRRPLRILVVYDGIWPSSIGGVEHRNSELARALSARGHRVTLAGWGEDDPARADGVEFLRLGPARHLYNAAGKRSTRGSLRLALDCARIDPRRWDLVETANIPYLHVVPLALRCWWARRPLLVTWHEYWGVYWREYLGWPAWPLYAAMEYLVAQAGTAVVAVSELTGARLAARRWRGALGVVPNGIPLEEIVRVTGAQERHGPPLIYAGRLLEEKRVDVLLRAIARLAPRIPGPLLTIVGTGPDEARLRDLADELKLEGSVTFTGRLAETSAVWERLGRAQVAVQPSSREGFGIFPLEAMAAGLPVVYCESSESALPELVRDGVEGITVEAEPEALAAVLDRLLSDRAERERLGAAATERARAYAWSAIAGRFEALAYGLVEGA